MNYEPDIITTIELEAANYIKRYRRLPDSITLSKNEFAAYEEERRAGRLPKIKYRGRETMLPVRRVTS